MIEIWTEKYRPSVLEDLVLSQENKEYFSDLKSVSHNYLFLGSSGTGKNSLAYILRDKFAPDTCLYVNASANNGIDTVRNEIENFLQVDFHLQENQCRLVILSEFDNFSHAGQSALREIMEQYLDSARFILTANYEHKIMEAISSRCQTFRFKPDLQEFKNRVSTVLKNENIKGIKENVVFVRDVITKHYPDLRKTLNELQKFCKTGLLVVPVEKDDIADFAETVWNKIKTDSWLAVRTYAYQNETSFGGDYYELMRKLYDFAVKDNDVLACSYLAEYMWRNQQSMDKEINFSGGFLTKVMKQ